MRYRKLTPGPWAVLSLAMLASAVAAAEPTVALSKEYVFKPHVELKIGAEVREGGEGVRLDTVQFLLPSDDRLIRFGDAVKADVSISNLGDESRKIGIAIALFAEDGALVGVASGGSKWMPIKPNRRSFYTLRFTDVNDRIRDATRFAITLEPK